MPWTPPSFTLQWGTYFKPDAEDEAKTVDTVIKAKDANVITQRTAVEKLRRVFGIESVADYLDQLEEEREEREEAEAAMVNAMASMSNDDDAEEPKPAAAKRRGQASDGGNSRVRAPDKKKA